MAKIAALAFGRLNPPSRAHEQVLVKTISEQQGDKMLFLSHSQDSKSNPLSYEQKVYYCTKAFSHMVNVVESEAKTMYQVLENLYKEGYTDIIYVCGSDRVAEAERLKQYNGKPTKAGIILFDFNSIKIVKAGDDRVNEDDIPLELVSASMMRQFVVDNDLESFMANCPSKLSQQDRKNMFNDVKVGLGLTEEFDSYTEEFKLVDDDYIGSLNSLIEAKGDNSVFKRHRDQATTSFADAYALLGSELKAAGADEDTMNQFNTAVQNIESITNSFDNVILSKLTKKLKLHNIKLSPVEFISTFNPNENDLKKFMSEPKFVTKGDGITDLSQFKFSDTFLKNLKTYRGGKSGSSANVNTGDYEFLISALFKGGKFADVGDASIDGKTIEVKHAEQRAVYGTGGSSNSAKSSDLVNRFSAFIDQFILTNQTTKNKQSLTRNAAKTIDVQQSDVISSAIEEICSLPLVQESNYKNELLSLRKKKEFKLVEMFDIIFKIIATNYQKDFDYLAIAYRDLIITIPKDSIIEYLLSDKVTLSFDDNRASGRTFKFMQRKL